ncbi:MAG: aminotransferase class V-fold PLP-dependent enzyme [Bacteroidota bacterium]
MIQRRNFLRTSFLGLAGLPVLAAAQRDTLEETWGNLWRDDDRNDEAYWESIRQEFPFENDLVYFNTGSLGPCPDFISKATNAFRATLDGFPSKYMWGGWYTEIEKVRGKAASLLNVSPEEIALVHNTTEGMNLIASSMKLKRGDEVILCDHEHMSSLAPWKYWQESKGIKLVRPKLPALTEDKEEIVEMYRKAITSKTKVISLVHISNQNGIVLPIKEISEMAHEKGVLVAVDGAQGIGAVDVDLADLGCDFYANSAHKWLFAPKGIGIFYAKKKQQKLLKPLIVARGYKGKTIRRFENYNTRNLPELLGLGAALDYRAKIGHEKIIARHYELKKYLRETVKGPKVHLKSADNDELSGPIQAIAPIGFYPSEVKKFLFENYKIDCRPMAVKNLFILRLSCSICISKKDIDTLLEGLDAFYKENTE